jgi:hypothetical protein
MLHLFNSCYVYPIYLFDPTKNYVLVREDHENSLIVKNSFFYNNSEPKDAFGTFKSFENFASSNLLNPAINNKELFIIYADNENFIKFFAAKLKTQVGNLKKEFFLDHAKLFAVRLMTRAKLVQSEEIRDNLTTLANMFLELTEIPDGNKLDLPDTWVRKNAGVEWKVSCGDYSTLDGIINRYVYSFFPEARAKYLSRKDPADSWVLDPNNQRYETVVSMESLYMEMRKEFNTFTDSTILKYYELKDIREMVKDPLFLLLLSANKNMGDKIDIWLLRWLLKMPKEQLKELSILA